MQATQRSCASNLAPRLMGGIQERITKSRTRNRQRHLAGSPWKPHRRTTNQWTLWHENRPIRASLCTVPMRMSRHLTWANTRESWENIFWQLQHQLRKDKNNSRLLQTIQTAVRLDRCGNLVVSNLQGLKNIVHSYVLFII